MSRLPASHGPTPAGRVTYALAFLSVLAYLSLGVPALSALGIPYTLPYGAFPFKIHPASYLMSLALLASLLAEGNPLAVLVQRLRDLPLLAAYLAGIGVACVYTLSRYGFSGAAFFVDTLFLPAFAVLVLARLTARRQWRIVQLILAMMLLNSLIALGEAVADRTLIPLNIAGHLITFQNDFRATALLGHPLENGLITGVVMLAMLDLPLSAGFKGLACLLFLLALLAYGGRTSFLLNGAALAIYTTARGWRGLRAGRHGYVAILAVAVTVIFAAPAAALAVWKSGLGYRVFEGLRVDNSAAVRLRIYDVFDFTQASDVLFGVSPEQVLVLSARIGLDPNFEAIENFWLVMLLQLGVFVFAAFAGGLLSGLYFLWRRSGGGGRWALLMFLLTASTTNSLASKTSSLAMLFIVAYCVASCRQQSRSLSSLHLQP